MSVAERQRRRRRRERDGRGVVHAEVNLADLADMLHAEGFLDDWRTANRAELSRALSQYLDAALRVTGHSSDAC